MRRRVLTGAGLIASSAGLIVALGVNGAAASAGAKTKKIYCTSKSYNVSYPQLSGRTLGVLNCAKPFGAGVQKGTSKASIVGGKVSVTGTFKNFYDTGTNHGTITLSGTLGSSGAITASGSVKVTGGTGAYKHMTGKGKVTCTTTDVGKTYNCTTHGTAKL